MSRAAFVLMLLLAPLEASGQTLYHRCMEGNPACNYTVHAIAGFGVTAFGIRIGVDPKLSAGAVSLMFVGKEVRDHMKWGREHDLRDAGFDILSGVAGAALRYAITHNKKVQDAGRDLDRSSLHSQRDRVVSGADCGGARRTMALPSALPQGQIVRGAAHCKG